MCVPSVLIVGESSTVSFLRWVLVDSNWSVSVVAPTQEKIKDREALWSMNTEDNLFEYAPQAVVANLSELSTLLTTKEGTNFTLDYIVITSDHLEEVWELSMCVRRVTNENTIILVDSSENPWILSKIDQYFPNNVVLSVCSDIDCRILGDKFNYHQLMNKIVDVIVGTDFYPKKLVTSDCLQGRGIHALKLVELKKTYEMSSYPGAVIIMPEYAHNDLSTIIWKKTISKVCFESLSIMFEEPDIITLAKDVSALPIMKGVYQELLKLCRKMKAYGLPKEYTIESKELLKTLTLAQGKKRQERSALLNKRCYLPKFIEGAKSFYDFSQGYQLNIVSILSNLLYLAEVNKTEVPFVESIFGFLTRLITIRDGVDINGKLCPSKLFQVKDNKWTAMKLKNINGIPPEKNMMNFSPFNPLPLPNPPTQFFIQKPLVFMSGIQLSKSPKIPDLPSNNSQLDLTNASDDIISIDSGVKEIIISTDDYGYTDRFDLEPKRTFIEDNKVRSKSNDDNQVKIYKPEPKPRINSSISQSSFYTANERVTSSSSLPNSYVISNFKTNSKKKTNGFYHSPTPITRHTSSQKLRESQANLLESIQFNGLMDQGASSRYGGLDTCSTALNSSNNSIRSSVGSSISLSRGS